jgi:hypothetical protein
MQQLQQPVQQQQQVQQAGKGGKGKLRREDKLDRECTMCFEMLPFVAFMPCGHRVMCRDCANLWASRNSMCSHCRQGITGIAE